MSAIEAEASRAVCDMLKRPRARSIDAIVIA
jgi:hypothetical protein